MAPVPFIPLQTTQRGGAVRLWGVCWLVFFFFEQLRQLEVLELEAL